MTRLKKLEAFAQYVIDHAPDVEPDQDDYDQAMMTDNHGDTYYAAVKATYADLAKKAREALADPDASGDAKKLPEFETMTQKEAVAYLHRHKDEYICGFSDVDEATESFGALVVLIETGHPPMSPTQLPEHGFEFPE